MPTIDGHYFRVCTRGAVRAGVSLASLLAEAGIDANDLSRPGWRGEVSAMARLVRAVWRSLGDEAMGYTSRGLPVGSLAFAVELAREGATVTAGLERAIRFYNLASGDIVTSLSLSGGEARIAVRFAQPSLDPDHYFAEFWLIIWHRLACWLASETVHLLRASFDYPRPGYFEEFRHLFPCPHEFDAREKSITMDARMLTVPVRRSAQEVAAMLEVAPLDIMTIPANDHSLARRVRALLLHDYAMSAPEIAGALDISGEVLRKRLRREGTTLSAQRQDVRRDAAMRALSLGHRSIEAIAADLGYAEPRSFTRAFRAWSGASPSHFRRPKPLPDKED